MILICVRSGEATLPMVIYMTAMADTRFTQLEMWYVFDDFLFSHSQIVVSKLNLHWQHKTLLWICFHHRYDTLSSSFCSC